MSSTVPEDPILDTTDKMAESPETEDADEGPDVQEIPGPSEPAADQDPLLHGGRKHSKKRGALPSERAGRKLNQSRAIGSNPPAPRLSRLIYTAIAGSQKKSGLSMQAVKKIVANMGYDMAKKKHYFLRSLKNMVAKGQLWQVKGTGATGSFKINPAIGKKILSLKGKGTKTKHSKKNKKKSAMSKNSKETAKKKAKADVKKSCKRGKMSSLQASSSQVKV